MSLFVCLSVYVHACVFVSSSVSLSLTHTCILYEFFCLSICANLNFHFTDRRTRFEIVLESTKQVLSMYNFITVSEVSSSFSPFKSKWYKIFCFYIAILHYLIQNLGIILFISVTGMLFIDAKHNAFELSDILRTHHSSV